MNDLIDREKSTMVWVAPYSILEDHKEKIRGNVSKSRGIHPSPETVNRFISNIEKFIAQELSMRSHPETISDDLNDIMQEISTVSGSLQNKLSRLNEWDKKIFGQYWFLHTNEIIDFRYVLETINKLKEAAKLHDPPSPQPGNPDTPKPAELQFCAVIASAWIFHFGIPPGIGDGGPFHRVLDVILPLTGYELVSYDILKKAIASAKIRKGM